MKMYLTLTAMLISISSVTFAGTGDSGSADTSIQAVQMPGQCAITEPLTKASSDCFSFDWSGRNIIESTQLGCNADSEMFDGFPVGRGHCDGSLKVKSVDGSEMVLKYSTWFEKQGPEVDPIQFFAIPYHLVSLKKMAKEENNKSQKYYATLLKRYGSK